MSEHLDVLLAELRQFRTTVQRLIDGVIAQHAQFKALQEVLLKKGLVTRKELAEAIAEASRQVKGGGLNRPVHRRRQHIRVAGKITPP